MRILVTGAFGYLGGRIAQSLAEEGHQVVLGSRTEKIIPNWLQQTEVVELVWNDKDSLQNACRNSDVVIHTAGMNAQDCALDPIGALDFNGIATAMLVQASKAVGVKKFIYLSTTHVYCSPLVGRITEESCPVNRHPYATSHVAGENAVLSRVNNEDNFRGIVLRLSNSVGTPVHRHANCWMLVINNLCRQVIESGEIVVNSPPNTERNYFPITLLCKTMNKIVGSSEIESTIINVSSSQGSSLQEVANIIKIRSASLFDFEPKVIFKGNNVMSRIPHLFISNAKLKKLVKVETNIISEIDVLLMNCKKWFSV